ncbi:MAG: peptide deformylase [Clostridiales bacterium]|jgi:peptide deformylase|nr:peptide deformylase [Clostridiales bacterium]MBF0985935.1 peptide deformylase [Clostridiales bacterium]
MAIRQLRYDGDEILRKKSRKVEEVDDKIRELMNDMVETMHAENGVGLSAVQVGILKRVIVIDLYDGTEPLKLVNPEILKVKGHRLVEEGCLSFPNKFALVDRPIEVTVKALNENGDEIKIKAKELLAQALCHEINHLDGVLFVDLMEPGTMEYIDPNNKK